MLLCAADIMIARNDDEGTRGGRRPRGGDQLQAEAAKSVKKGVRMRDGGCPAGYQARRVLVVRGSYQAGTLELPILEESVSR